MKYSTLKGSVFNTVISNRNNYIKTIQKEPEI